MVFYYQYAFSETLARALLIVLCLLVSFGSSTAHLVGSLLPNGFVIAVEESLTELGTVPEEVPQESPSPIEPVEEGETATFAVRRKCPRCIRIHFQLVNVARLSNYHLHSMQERYATSRTAAARFEHCARNGCGAHLRC